LRKEPQHSPRLRRCFRHPKPYSARLTRASSAEPNRETADIEPSASSIIGLRAGVSRQGALEPFPRSGTGKAGGDRGFMAAVLEANPADPTSHVTGPHQAEGKPASSSGDVFGFGHQSVECRHGRVVELMSVVLWARKESERRAAWMDSLASHVLPRAHRMYFGGVRSRATEFPRGRRNEMRQTRRIDEPQQRKVESAKSATAAQVQQVARLPVQQARLCSEPLQVPAGQFQGRAPMHLFPASRTHIIRDALWGHNREKRRRVIRGSRVCTYLLRWSRGRVQILGSCHVILQSQKCPDDSVRSK
jgi:hypothetical protein